MICADIEKRAAEGDERARLAIGVLRHRVRKYIGAYAAVMGGLDRSRADRRHRRERRGNAVCGSCSASTTLGLIVDDERNSDARLDAKNPSRGSARNEPRDRARGAHERGARDRAPDRARGAASASRRRTTRIPIAVSARHFHLCAASFEKLFGPGKQPTRWRDISQPGQYACEEKVNLIGPRGRIDGVRLLGPLRGKDQVEISRTDEFKLGVDAPVRDSGKTEGLGADHPRRARGHAAPARRADLRKAHIHMAPADAKRFGVQDGDEVEVKITGGPRDLTFGDVLIRVSPMFVLEMHIDTDEANAAEIDQGASGGLAYTDARGLAGTLVSRARDPIREARRDRRGVQSAGSPRRRHP
jgi:acetate kinase